MEYQLPSLPYPMDALEPHISAETLEYHHGKHHAKYVATLNQLLEEKGWTGKPLDEVIREAEEGPLFNNAAQTFNHDFYWKCLSPTPSVPSGELKEAIDKAFGSVDAFTEAFTKKAAGLFGSGWTWLIIGKDGNLAIENGGNADTPLRRGDHPLLTCDVWEHAYYIDYRNARPKYLEAFWKLVNWDFVSENYKRKRQVASNG